MLWQWPVVPLDCLVIQHRGGRRGDASAAVRADLDDTLLPTTAADAKALQDVAALLADSHPDVQWDAVHAAWKTAFGKAPWDAQHKVLTRRAVSRPVKLFC